MKNNNHEGDKESKDKNAGEVATVAAGHDPGELQTMKVDRQL